MWRKGNLSALLVGLQTGAATMENSVEFPKKTINGTATVENSMELPQKAKNGTAL